MLVLEQVSVEVGGQRLLRDIDMQILPGETHVMFGPNGSGKTSLLMAIMGYPGYTVSHGKISFQDQDITELPLDERARRGIGMAFQRPPTINGLKTRRLVELAAGAGSDVAALAERVQLGRLLDRDVNAGLSGGEIKRSELLQLMAQDPELFLFDEPESGVDVENLPLVGNTIAELLQRRGHCAPGQSIKDFRNHRSKMGLIITHTGHILEHFCADKAQVLYDGAIACSNRPREILECIEQQGYEECMTCSLDKS